MDPIEKLMDEHQNILAGIDILARNADRLEKGEKVDPRFFNEAIDFIRNYADRYHHAKEEDILFKKMEKAGFPVEGGPIAVMLSEHDQGRHYVRAMEKANERYIVGDKSAVNEIAENAKSYVYLLRAHIDKEDRILYPMARNALGESGIEAMRPDFDRVEKEKSGTEEKYKALLKELESY
ncbi:MAG: hemerythrin domain-containing protein [Candidatus Zixiibacteriota bacterium]|nr:MAG: hemerythrin domain-containing protein [candidate division Zixibacteria bacterium]